MQRAMLFAPVLTLVFAACASASFAQSSPGAAPLAQSPAELRGRFVGAYYYAGGASERAGVTAAIEYSISRLAFFVAPFARGPLTSHNPIYPDIAIRMLPGQIVIDYNHHTWAMPDTGVAVATRTDLNDPAHVSQWLERDHLVQLINAADGGRRNEFYLSPDGATLTLRATMFSPRLPAPVRYSLTYRRR